MDNQGMGPGSDQRNVYERAAAESVNLPMAIVGAAGGAALGALVWFLLEYYANLQVGYVALGCGVAAGFGAVALGKGHGVQVGVIAAAFGALGIIGGSYGSYVAQKADAEKKLDEIVAAQPDENRAAVRKEVDARLDEYTFIEHTTGDTKSLMFMLIFGAIGCGVGFKTGMGGMGDDA